MCQKPKKKNKKKNKNKQTKQNKSEDYKNRLEAAQLENKISQSEKS